MPILEIIRNIVVAVAATISLFHYGPHIVDQYYLPTIDYMADTFLAVAPQPPPATTFARVQSPMAVARTTMMTNTIFVKEAAFTARSAPQGAMITGVKHHQRFLLPFHNILDQRANLVTVTPHPSRMASSTRFPSLSSGLLELFTKSLELSSSTCRNSYLISPTRSTCSLEPRSAGSLLKCGARRISNCS